MQTEVYQQNVLQGGGKSFNDEKRGVFNKQCDSTHKPKNETAYFGAKVGHLPQQEAVSRLTSFDNRLWLLMK